MKKREFWCVKNGRTTLGFESKEMALENIKEDLHDGIFCAREADPEREKVFEEMIESLKSNHDGNCDCDTCKNIASLIIRAEELK